MKKQTLLPDQLTAGGQTTTTETKPARAASRRKFLGSVSGAAAATLTATAIAPAAQAQFNPGPKPACDEPFFPLGYEPPSMASNRYMKAYKCRTAAAKVARERRLVYHQNNGDESRYENWIGSYSKGLPHNQLGEVEREAYATLVRAREGNSPQLYEQITLGLGRKLTSPQAGLAMDLQGPDSHHVTLPPAPTFSSAEEAGEMVELYWMALLRDVGFHEYDTHPLVAAACDEISQLNDFRGPRADGRVTPQTLFRLNVPEDTNGPWMSQFLLQNFYFGANFFSNKMRTTPAGQEFMTSYADWLTVQNGGVPQSIAYDPVLRYQRNLRDVAEWVHVDALYQAYLQAALILMGQGAPLDGGLPLANSKTQLPFAQCGGPHILSLVTEVATRALKAVWYQKWFVHHRLRPEAFGGRVHNHITNAARYPIHGDVLNSRAVAETFSRFGTYLLPQPFPEGSPTHPSYGSGHATVAGACVTILKAFFDEDAIVKSPVVPNADGTELVPYVGEPLTVRGELNKVARNVANGRNGAGVHWRTDAIEGMKLGETVAIGILEEQKVTYNEDLDMTFTKFDGTRVTI